MASVEALRRSAQDAGLKLVVLFGSRARGSARPQSDWDLCFISGASGDPDAFLAEATRILQTDQVDLADLGRASALLRYRAAAEGKLVHETTPGEFERFQIAATQYWCSVAPVLRLAYQGILRDLSPA